jgi:hypothetical protein
VATIYQEEISGTHSKKLNAKASVTMSYMLYRRILRLHRQKLSFALRALGDQYVQTEFRQHRGAQPEFMEQFTAQWTDYAETLEKQSKNEDNNAIGRDLTEGELDALSEEQTEQLLKVRDQSKKV